MLLHERLQRLASMRCEEPTVSLELPDGKLIYCRDEEQAMYIEGLWLAFTSNHFEQNDDPPECLPDRA